LDLSALYELLAKEQQELHRFYDLVRSKSGAALFDGSFLELEWEIEEFLAYVGLQKSDDALLAAINRIVNLQEDLFLQQIRGYDEETRIRMRQRAYDWVARFYTRRFWRLIHLIEKRRLLSPFYLRLVRHVHGIGEVMNRWHRKWMSRIVFGVNRELSRLFNGDEEKILEMLAAKGLFDRGHGGERADRCYSLLQKRGDGEFERLSYAQAFPTESEEVRRRLGWAIEELKGLEDRDFGQKREWIAYLEAIREAFGEMDPDRGVERWAQVDRAWMEITTPIQVGHPMEYYEDRYRRAVALEWDVRLADPNHGKEGVLRQVKAAFRHYYLKIGIDAGEVYRQTLESLDRVQLYVGRPLSFYGSELGGLFSAQVVPNDEVVSRELGKKIFAYADMVYATQKAKPRMRLGREVYGEDLYERFRRIYDRPKIWRQIYEISTIGHEYGHILWMDATTETAMNGSGHFKDLEEFKATSGALVGYFLYGEDGLWEYLLEDTLTRAVSLVGWMEVDEVRPYYIEGLLHLHALFASGVLDFDGRLRCRLERNSYERLREWYLQIYEDLARHYLQKRDAKEFLQRYVAFGVQAMPKDPKVRAFVEYYYDLYRKLGLKLDGV